MCDGAVRRVARIDRRARIAFAPLQGELARQRGFGGYAAPADGTMLLLRESDGRIFTHSDACIELARALGGVWRIFTLARWIPKPLRDGAYRWIARHRQQFLTAGKFAATCQECDPLPPERLRK